MCVCMCIYIRIKLAIINAQCTFTFGCVFLLKNRQF